MSKMKQLLFPAVLALSTAFVCPQVRAQDLLEPPRPRQGYFIAFGLQGGVNQTWDAGEKLRLTPGSGFDLRLGQLLTRRFGLALQINSGGGTSGSGDDKKTLGTFGLGFEAQWELAPNLAVRGDIGLGVISLLEKGDPEDEKEKQRGGVGAAYGLGLGYDWYPGVKRKTGGWAVTPVANARFIPGGTLKTFVASVGVQMTYWTGLPRNQLDLPDGEAYKRIP